MEKVEVTWPIALRVWWSYTWRLVLITFVVVFLGSISFGFISVILPFSKEVLSVVANILGFLLTVIPQIYVIKKLLTKKYKKFSISVVREG